MQNNFLIIILALISLSLHAEDWTIAGKTYQNVVVGQVEADCVHITYANGIGRVMIADMPTDLQKRFGYDSTKAEAAERAKENARAASEAYLVANYKPAAAATNDAPSTAPVTAPAARVGLSPEDRQGIQDAITSLTADLASKQAELNRNAHDENNHKISSQNGLRDAMAEEASRLAALQAQLNK